MPAAARFLRMLVAAVAICGAAVRAAGAPTGGLLVDDDSGGVVFGATEAQRVNLFRGGADRRLVLDAPLVVEDVDLKAVLLEMQGELAALQARVDEQDGEIAALSTRLEAAEAVTGALGALSSESAINDAIDAAAATGGAVANSTVEAVLADYQLSGANIPAGTITSDHILDSTITHSDRNPESAVTTTSLQLARLELNTTAIVHATALRIKAFLVQRCEIGVKTDLGTLTRSGFLSIRAGNPASGEQGRHYLIAYFRSSLGSNLSSLTSVAHNASPFSCAFDLSNDGLLSTTCSDHTTNVNVVVFGSD